MLRELSSAAQWGPNPHVFSAILPIALGKDLRIWFPGSKPFLVASGPNKNNDGKAWL